MLRPRERVGSRVDSWLNNTGTRYADWERPIDWLALPEAAANTFKGLHAVYDTDTNFCTIKVTTSAGDYTIDWGDGDSKADCVSATTYEHVYDKAVYAALGAGTYCSRGYKQVIVTVTPNAGNITAIDLSIRHTSENQIYVTQWLDINWNAASCTSFITYLASTGQNAGILERCAIGSHSITDFTKMFYSCYSLQSVSLLDTSAGTTFSYMFASCYNLQSVPLFDTSSGTSFSFMFSYCYSLQSVPLFDTSAGTIFSFMFSYCHSLQSVPLFDTSSGTDFTSMFNSCYSLQSVPLFDTSAGTIFTSMFGSCRSLQKGTLDKPLVLLSYINCRLAKAEIVDIFNNLYDFRDVITIDVSPATDWAADDVITGQTSGAVCTVVSKIDATHYIVKSRGATAFQVGEIIGVTGTPAKLADQGAAHPTFSAIEHLLLNVAPETTWVAGETVTGTTSTKTAVIVEKFSNLLYSVKSRSGAFTLGEILSIGGARPADQGGSYPKFYGRAGIAGVTAPTITITGNWGAATLGAADNLLATNKGWTIVA